MCLSSIYVEDKDTTTAVVEEASQIRVNAKGELEIITLFGEKKLMGGYRIAEVNFLKNYVLLKEEGSHQ